MTSVTVMVPMAIRRRGGRKQIVGPDGLPMKVGGDGAEETRGNPVLVKALARAFRWRRMLEDGRYGSIRELAKAEGVDRSHIGRLLNLTLLAPELVEAALNGWGFIEMTLEDLTRSAAVRKAVGLTTLRESASTDDSTCAYPDHRKFDATWKGRG